MRGKRVVLTKVTRPRLQLTYQRTELYDLLDELSARPLIMINGQSGSGKTTLISDYIENRNLPCLWYQLDKDDQDLSVFFYYLGIALLRTNPYSKSSLPYGSPERIINVPVLAREYFRKLYQCLESPFLIVFDNYQTVPQDAALHSIIAEACNALPPGGRIVLISDGGSQSNLELKTHGGRAVLGYEELQLSPAEVKRIAMLHGVSLQSDQAAKQLQMRVGGWIAGLIQELKRESLSPVTPS